MKFQIIFIVILALAAGKTAGEVFAELAKTNNWGRELVPIFATTWTTSLDYNIL